jgi:Protein of unknown function (DUF4239)
MDILFALARIPVWLSGLLIVGLSVAAAVGAMLYVRRKIGVARLLLNNEVAGFKFATLGVVYAVLLAFVVIAVWERYETAETVVEIEGDAVLDLHALSYGLGEEQGREIRGLLQHYVTSVIGSEWPAMADGRADPAGARAFREAARAVVRLQPETPRDQELFAHALNLLGTMSDNRRQRLAAAEGALPGVMWLVLAFGAAVTIGYTAFFGAQNVVAQALMTAALSLMVMVVFFLTVLLNYPFTGDVRIGPDRFRDVLVQMRADDPGAQGAIAGPRPCRPVPSESGLAHVNAL